MVSGDSGDGAEEVAAAVVDNSNSVNDAVDDDDDLGDVAAEGSSTGAEGVEVVGSTAPLEDAAVAESGVCCASSGKENSSSEGVGTCLFGTGSGVI